MSSDQIVLEPVSASVPEARRFVADRLTGLPGDTVEVARLLVSELVTNAVLHAHTDLTLTLSRVGQVVRVEVADQSPRLPVMRTHGQDAGTGRGLRVLDSMAKRWGSDGAGDGKVVWFEIDADPSPEPPAPPARAPTAEPTALASATPVHSDPGEVRVPRPDELRGEYGQNEGIMAFRWIGMPISKLDRTAEHYDSVLREFQIMLERRPSDRADVPGRLIALMDELTQFGPLISVVEQNIERGRNDGSGVLDVELQLPSAIGPIALRLANLLDETDAYCAAGIELLSLQPTDEVVNLRKWLVGELVRQAEGHPPVAWSDSPWSGAA
jgi:Histidine kinase-like ATPase domain